MAIVQGDGHDDKRDAVSECIRSPVAASSVGMAMSDGPQSQGINNTSDLTNQAGCVTMATGTAGLAPLAHPFCLNAPRKHVDDSHPSWA